MIGIMEVDCCEILRRDEMMVDNELNVNWYMRTVLINLRASGQRAGAGGLTVTLLGSCSFAFRLGKLFFF